MSEKLYHIPPDGEGFKQSSNYNFGNKKSIFYTQAITIGAIYAQDITDITKNISEEFRPPTDTIRPLFNKVGTLIGSLIIKKTGEVSTNLLDGYSLEDVNNEIITYPVKELNPYYGDD